MKPFAFVLCCLILLAAPATTHGSDQLKVQDPRSWWRGGQGTIEQSVLSVRPAGIYMEYGLYLTFSARGLGYTHSDTFEVQFNFDLPAGSIVHDSWLWIGDTIIRGELLDKWTAESIYEDIVNRRRDPSILFKRSDTQYELRIFPMAGDESRKVKITYLVQTRWNSKRVHAPLPTGLIRTSKNPVSALSVLTWPDDDWRNPSIPDVEGLTFDPGYDTVLGNYFRADVLWGDLSRKLDLSYDAPLRNGVFVNHTVVGSGGYYQLALLPSEALDLSVSRKAAILFDYDASKSLLTPEEVIATVRRELFASFTTRDSFNIILSQVNIRRVSETWLPADSVTVDSVFSTLGPTPLPSYSNLPALLANGVGFVNGSGPNGAILLVSNSDGVGGYVAGNQLIGDLTDLMTNTIPITVVDFQSRNFTYNYIGNRTYYGNEYFYTNIARLTGGDYLPLRTGSPYQPYRDLGGVIPAALQSLGGFISSFDLYTKAEGGFCYGRLYPGLAGGTTYVGGSILQTGRYYGSFPLTVEISGIYQGSVFNEAFVLEDSTTSLIDSLTTEIWAGNYVRSLEGQTQSNDVIDDIIRASIDERVLSVYSAFICLEPSRGGEVCYDCLDESGSTVGVSDSTATVDGDSLLIAYPNPFNSSTTIRLTVPASVDRGPASLKIYDVLGREVRDFDLTSSGAGGTTEIVWNGTTDDGNPVNSGVYFVVYRTGSKVQSLKLMMLK